MAEKRSKWDSASSPPADPAAAAAAAAAKIAASLAPPTGAASSSSSSAVASGSRRSDSTPHERRGADAHDAEFQHDIEINDQRNRYMLTKGQTQASLHKETGASITTKGTWYPDKSMATKEEPPLYLHISAVSQEILDHAIRRIHELMAEEMPQLVEDRHQKRLDWESQKPPPREKRRFIEDKVYLNLEQLRNFNVRAKVVGPGGLFVKYIQNETGTRVQIKGQGSGFVETDTGREAEDPMHISISGPEEEGVKQAKTLSEDLVDAVRTEWQKAKDALGQVGGPFGGGGGGGFGGPPRGPAGMGGGGYGPQGGGFGGGPQGSWGGPYGQQQVGWGGGYQAPLPDGNPPPPPPPEDDAPPPPPSDGGANGHGGSSYRQPQVPVGSSQSPYNNQQGYGSSQRGSSQSSATPAPATTSASVSVIPVALTPEEEALDKYWKEYVTWEESFKAYHGRLPNKDEGGQDVPAKYKK
ncbi:hypothetical protein IE53DRAFT_385652 [Violaceomyces palustris]|uniref:Uncharacterized protein n=1 Tax=Violaceomyces palustris TaxID=1673888 RepID=A0ACD0P1R9_9BASI|nr:hypothetical protein IE53DRAFT_385652 [Violaceomyces palustris]